MDQLTEKNTELKHAGAVLSIFILHGGSFRGITASATTAVLANVLLILLSPILAFGDCDITYSGGVPGAICTTIEEAYAALDSYSCIAYPPPPGCSSCSVTDHTLMWNPWFGAVATNTYSCQGGGSSTQSGSFVPIVECLTSWPARPCYTGPAGTEGVGTCKAGTQTCHPGYGYWMPCEGQTLPQNEMCDNLDNNCNGAVDEGKDACCKDPICCGDPECCPEE